MSNLMLQCTGVEVGTRLSVISTDGAKAFMLEQGKTGAGRICLTWASVLCWRVLLAWILLACLTSLLVHFTLVLCALLHGGVHI
jgi:hypothetical protein